MQHAKEWIGLALTPYRYEIEKNKIIELAKAIGDDNPTYRSVEAAQAAGYEGIPVPITFLQVVDNWGGPGIDELVRKLGLNKARLLHGEQQFEYVADIYAGDELSVRSKVVHIETKSGASGGMDLITTENEYTNQQGVLAAVSRRVLVHRHEPRASHAKE